ncbi:MAG: RNA chaperone Hfq [bacterium]|jgi:host factor-I protein|nr:RNA chaperone Hfq [bacterium]
MAKSVMNIQDSFLNQARRERITLDLHLIDGSELNGKISAFDNFTIILLNEDRDEQHLIYKHAIATVRPSGSSRVRWNQMGDDKKPGRDK